MGLRWIYARLDSLAEWSCVRPDLKICAIMNWHHDLLFGICNVNKSSFLEACRGRRIYGHIQLAHHSAIRAMGGCRIICVHERAVGIYMYSSHISAKPGADMPREFHHM